MSNLQRKKMAYLYMIIIAVIVLGGLYLLLRKDNTSPANSNNGNVVTTTIPGSQDPFQKTSSFYSEVTIPSGYSAQENKEGNGVSYKIYSQTIRNPQNTVNVIIESIPKNIETRVNTGVAGYEVPADALANKMIFVTKIENNELYIEDYKTKFSLADRDSSRGEPGSYLSVDRKVVFRLFVKTNNPAQPFVSIFKTSNSQEVSIRAVIDFDLGIDAFKQAVEDYLTILRSLKV